MGKSLLKSPWNVRTNIVALSFAAEADADVAVVRRDA